MMSGRVGSNPVRVRALAPAVSAVGVASARPLDNFRVVLEPGSVIAGKLVGLEARPADRSAIAPDGSSCAGNAPVGLTLALAAAAEPGGLCLMPSFTFVASAHAARAAGLMPCFVDVEPGSWALTPELARAALRRLGGRVAAVMPVAVFGAPPDPAAWDAFGAETGIPVVIDAAAAYDGARVGRGATVVSLHASKILGVGEGGFVAAGDAALVQSVRHRSNFGFHGRRTAEVAGMNGKISEYACAVGLAAMDDGAALPFADADLDRR